MGYTPLFGGFSPMTADGYGVCYSFPGDGRMNIFVTAWRSCAETDAAAFACAARLGKGPVFETRLQLRSVPAD